MDYKERYKELRRVLYNEIKSELSYNEKKEFAKDTCDERVLARLLEKNRKRKRTFSFFVIFYSVFLMVLLILFLAMAERLIIIILVTLAVIILPVMIVSIFTNKAFLGYQKLDLVLRLITKFYVKRKNLS